MIKREKTMKTDTKKTYDSALDNLLVGIGNDYENWNSPYAKTDWTKVEKKIRIESINKFKNTLYVKPGRKFDKVIHGTSVWGFVAKTDGVHKGIPYKEGDVLPHRRTVKWYPKSIARSAMSQALQHSTGSGTVSNISKYSDEIESLIADNKLNLEDVLQLSVSSGKICIILKMICDCVCFY